MRTAIITILLLAYLLFLSGCNADVHNNIACKGSTCNAVLGAESAEERQISVDKLEIYHFHGTNQCYSCITVGNYAEETVNTYFADELKAGKIVFRHINGELMENRDLVIKYGVTGSSLWIGTYDTKGFHKEENINVWYKIRDKNDYMNYLKGVMEKRLVGDFN